MKLSKVAFTGLLAVALMSTSCDSKSDDSKDMDHNGESTHMHDGDRHEHSKDGHKHPHGEGDHGKHRHKDGKRMDEDTSNIPHETSPVVEREEVKLALLPPAVTEKLGSQEYIDWKVERAFKLEQDGVTTYEIAVKKDGENATLHFNEKGIRLDR
ncbi:hypothetical protein [Brumimicrobium aurantiacum]|uniref:Uncharacterized protein n=1 Tax=Brumimicrobium aurantiacum TaxID=1737063 RepID=A0A3E1EVX4_9FLAO|nr:hypothetical protein [Brumimicrobium aurantiacum]RFC53710.1 hypothetical protein DXU93_11310 [Brumimicrobium aurantiacum]